MSRLTALIGILLLLPGTGCTLCCAPYDECGPLCNGECGGGCCSTARAGGYSYSQADYYEEVTPTRAPRLAPTPAAPRPTPAPEVAPETTPPTETPEVESPGDMDLETPFDDFTPEATEAIPTTPDATEPIPGTEPEETPLDFDTGIPPE